MNNTYTELTCAQQQQLNWTEDTMSYMHAEYKCDHNIRAGRVGLAPETKQDKEVINMQMK